jgi:hypothetical protein
MSMHLAKTGPNRQLRSGTSAFGHPYAALVRRRGDLCEAHRGSDHSEPKAAGDGGTRIISPRRPHN